MLDELQGVFLRYRGSIPVRFEVVEEGHFRAIIEPHTLYRLDVDYMIKDGQVVIVDEFTGRLMPGRRWSDGLHQAVEAKEKVKIERENQTLATITFQNYFRKYKKLSGMTGTADTEAEEFAKIYKLDVMVIPTNRPLLRVEEPERGHPALAQVSMNLLDFGTTPLWSAWDAVAELAAQGPVKLREGPCRAPASGGPRRARPGGTGPRPPRAVAAD